MTLGLSIAEYADLRERGSVEILHENAAGNIVGRIAIDGVERVYIAPPTGDDIIPIEQS